jgi:hypothetical protein
LPGCGLVTPETPAVPPSAALLPERTYLALFFYWLIWQPYCEFLKANYMANQGNKHPGSGKDKKNKNQPSGSNQGNDKGAHKESDINPKSPEKRFQIDDNPEGTKRKIPH